MENPFPIGRRVYLRPLERTDAQRVAPWLNEPEVRHITNHAVLHFDLAFCTMYR